MTSRIIRLPEVINLTGLSRSTIYARIAEPENQFPRPVSLGGRLVGWRESDIQQWIEERESTTTSKAKEA
jgi:prophage regulatory protein